jgi:hypothetical protein
VHVCGHFASKGYSDSCLCICLEIFVLGTVHSVCYKLVHTCVRVRVCVCVADARASSLTLARFRFVFLISCIGNFFLSGYMTNRSRCNCSLHCIAEHHQVELWFRSCALCYLFLICEEFCGPFYLIFETKCWVLWSTVFGQNRKVFCSFHVFTVIMC